MRPPSGGSQKRHDTGNLRVSVTAAAPEARIELRGELSLSSYDELERALDAAEQVDAPRLVIDLSRLTAIDSTGIGCLVHAVERAREAGADVELIQGPKAVSEVFEMVGLVDVLPFRASQSPATERGR